MPPPQQVKRVSAERIRATFNNSQLPTQILNGSLHAVVLKDSPLQDPAGRGEPPGTRSQIIRYHDASGQWLVVVHQYLRPDGTLGGSGKPDPKRLRVNQTILLVDP